MMLRKSRIKEKEVTQNRRLNLEAKHLRVVLLLSTLLVLANIDSKYILKLLFYIYSLVSHRRYDVTPHTSVVCFATNNFSPNFFQNYPLAESPCSLGHNFRNQIIVLENQTQVEQTWQSFWEMLTYDGKAHSVNDIWQRAEIAMKQHVISKIELHAKSIGIQLSDEWKNYFKQISRLVVHSELANHDNGVCDDSASLGVVNALKDQLDSGYRETVAIVVLHQPEGHAFTVTNFKNVTDLTDKHASDTSKAVRSVEDYSKILKSAEPLNSKRSVTCCDAWLDFHGSADDFAKAYTKKNRQQKESQTATKPQIKVSVYDYTIPSFRANRDENNPQFRSFIKNALRWMLGVNQIEPEKIAHYSRRNISMRHHD